MIKNKYILLSLLLTLILSCNQNGSKKIYIDTGYPPESPVREIIDRTLITVPYREDGGVKIIRVNINGVGFDMVFDTGCSGTLISPAEAYYLVQKGFLTKEDILGFSQSMIADGSIVDNTVINLKTVCIGNEINFYNVTATVSEKISAPLLLGNEVLDKTSSYTIDNTNKTILFKLK